MAIRIGNPPEARQYDFPVKLSVEGLVRGRCANCDGPMSGYMAVGSRLVKGLYCRVKCVRQAERKEDLWVPAYYLDSATAAEQLARGLGRRGARGLGYALSGASYA